jgi:hypothetical protein
VFGVFIDLPLIAGGFFIMFRFKMKFARVILRVKHPPLALSDSLAPLIIFEEQIDCMPAWCGTVAMPLTLPFILVEMLVLGGTVLWRHAKNVSRVTLFFSIFGVLWEVFLGRLVGAPLIIIALLAPYVGVGYAFISMLPLTVLMEGQAVLGDGKAGLLMPPPPPL